EFSFHNQREVLVLILSQLDAGLARILGILGIEKLQFSQNATGAKSPIRVPSEPGIQTQPGPGRRAGIADPAEESDGRSGKAAIALGSEPGQPEVQGIDRCLVQLGENPGRLVQDNPRVGRANSQSVLRGPIDTVIYREEL